MDAPGLIASFATGTYTVTRRPSAGTGTDGRRIAPTTTPITITAAIVPLSGREIERLEDGMRAEDLRNVFTSTLLKTVEPGYEPDLVTVDGVTWAVEGVQTWPGYYQARVHREGSP